MSIAAHVGVKDEIELLPHCLTHLLAIGVDRLLVTDMGSTDGSWEWLQEAASGLPLSTRTSPSSSRVTDIQRLKPGLPGAAALKGRIRSRLD